MRVLLAVSPFIATGLLYRATFLDVFRRSSTPPPDRWRWRTASPALIACLTPISGAYDTDVGQGVLGARLAVAAAGILFVVAVFTLFSGAHGYYRLFVPPGIGDREYPFLAPKYLIASGGSLIVVAAAVVSVIE